MILGRLHVVNNDTEADGDLRCQAGARWEDINETLKEKGIPLFFPVSNQVEVRSLHKAKSCSSIQGLARYVTKANLSLSYLNFKRL